MLPDPFEDVQEIQEWVAFEILAGGSANGSANIIMGKTGLSGPSEVHVAIHLAFPALEMFQSLVIIFA